jgi:hypothetical protein
VSAETAIRLCSRLSKVWAIAASGGIPSSGIIPVCVEWMLCWFATWTVIGVVVGCLLMRGVSLSKQLMLAPESTIVFGGEEPSIVTKLFADRLVVFKLLFVVLGVPLGQEVLLVLGSAFSWLPCSLMFLVLPPILLWKVALGWWPSLGEWQSLLAWAHDPWDQQ